MSGVLAGLDVLDLSWGISGPIAGMLLADHGAKVTKIEPPGGDPFRSMSGARVWSRGKRSAVIDLRDGDQRTHFLALASRADVVLESFAPRTAERLGIGYETLAAANPRLVHCSITAYGDTGIARDRPGYDALVAARTGQLWETRGIVGTTICRLSGVDPALADLDSPPEMWIGPRRDGPLFSGVPWPSLAAGYLATIAISAALRSRELTGRGQHVATSLLQGVLASTGMAWQRVERPRSPGYLSWVVDPRAPKGFFRTADGDWVHQWLPVPGAVLTAAGEGTVDGSAPAPAISTAIEDLPLLHAHLPRMAEAFLRRPTAAWLDAADAFGFALQALRSPEAALDDPELLADGCVIEVDDPEVGRIRHVGHTYLLSACPSPVLGPAPRPGQHTDEVLAEASARRRRVEGRPPSATHGTPPLDGVVVLDLGLAVAGPFATKILADLGADVIKVGAPGDFWLHTQFGVNCNTSKRSFAVDLKHPDGYRTFERLLSTADVMLINWRPEPVARLGLDYETVRRVRPDLIYCQTHGFERGSRRRRPGNDQMAGALAGTEWLDGGLDDDGEPLWPPFSLGDTGNGLLAAIGIIQALYHRDRTGEGQLVESSIMYAHLLNASSTWVAAGGSPRAARPSVDRDLRGWNALYRLYAASDGWICIAALTDQHWVALCRAVDREELATDRRFAAAAARAEHDVALGAILDAVFVTAPASSWFDRLDRHGVPCELARHGGIADLFDDPLLKERGWIAAYDHPVVGRMEATGRYFDLAGTPGPVPGPAPVSGQHTAAILTELGYSADEIDALAASGAIEVASVTAAVG